MIKDTLNPLVYLSPVNYTEDLVASVSAALKADAMLKQDLPYDPSFAKEELEKIAEMKWLSEMTMTLVSPTTKGEEGHKEELDSFLDTLEEEAFQMDEQIGRKNPLPVIAVDLETTGLSKRLRFVGGHRIADTKTVGICLAVDGFKGYYLPVYHNGKDGVPNWDEEAIRDFMAKLDKRFFKIFHNAQYDREIISQWGIKQNYAYTDSMQLAIHVGLTEKYRTMGLKFLSSELLFRKMLEINELMGTKDFLRLDYLPAKQVAVYGISDACNTYALFDLLTSGEDEDYENPYKVSKPAITLDMKSMDHIRSAFRLGLPIDDERAEKYIKTLMHRTEILREKIYRVLPDTVSITSKEQLGVFIGNNLLEQFRKKYESKMPEAKLIVKFSESIMNLFGMEYKVRKLKSSTKVVYSFDENVVKNLIDKLEKVKWVDDEFAKEIVEFSKLLLEFNKINGLLSDMKPVYRNLYNDDMGWCRFQGGLRVNGACVVGSTKIRIKHDYVSEISIEELSKYINKQNLRVETPDGWQPIGAFIQKAPDLCYRMETTRGLVCEASQKHLFQRGDGTFDYAMNFKEGDTVLTENGIEIVVRIEKTTVKPIYDLEVLHPNHRYYTDGISSHNSKTHRFSNESAMSGGPSGHKIGNLPRVIINDKGKAKMVPAGPVAGINIQGIPSTSKVMAKAKRLTKLPSKIKKYYDEIEENINSKFFEYVREI